MRGLSRQMIQATRCMYVAVGLAGMACTSARENSEFNAAVPTTIQSDADRRAIYNNGSAVNTSAPASVPRRLDNQASEVNRQKNIENRSVNNPNNEPLEVRTRRLGRPTADTLR